MQSFFELFFHRTPSGKPRHNRVVLIRLPVRSSSDQIQWVLRGNEPEPVSPEPDLDLSEEEEAGEAMPAPVPVPEPGPKPAPAPEPVPEKQPAPAPKPDPVPEKQPAPAPKPEPVPEKKPEPVPKPDPVPEKQPEPVPKPDPVPEKQPAPAPKPEPISSSVPAAAEKPASEPRWHEPVREVMPRAAILARAKQAEQTVRNWINDYGGKYDQLEFAFNFVPGGNRVHVVTDDEIPDDLWFIGDLHGDILALEEALSYIDSHSFRPTIVFLGDLFDRFDYGWQVLMRVVALIKERPGRILWIAGNHDDGFLFHNGKFASTVSPSEFVDFMNDHPEYEAIGKWAIGLIAQLPRALFLPDGLFVAHGGCPSFDMNTFEHIIDRVTSPDELEKPEYLKTFIWNRIVPDQDDKSGDEVGKNDLRHFMDAMGKLTGCPVKRMLRGHDHCRESRHEFFGSYYPDAPVLTLTTMSAWYLGSPTAPPEMAKPLRKAPLTTPAIARFRCGALPDVITLEIPRSTVEQFHQVEDLSPKH